MPWASSPEKSFNLTDFEVRCPRDLVGLSAHFASSQCQISGGSVIPDMRTDDSRISLQSPRT